MDSHFFSHWTAKDSKATFVSTLLPSGRGLSGWVWFKVTSSRLVLTQQKSGAKFRAAWVDLQPEAEVLGLYRLPPCTSVEDPNQPCGGQHRLITTLPLAHSTVATDTDKRGYFKLALVVQVITLSLLEAHL